MLQAKADGYQQLLDRSAATRKHLARDAVDGRERCRNWSSEQVKAIQNLKIDKITVWDSGANGYGDAPGGSTSNFLRGLIGSLPPIHELAEQAGIDLPDVLGKVRDTDVVTPPPDEPTV